MTTELRIKEIVEQVYKLDITSKSRKMAYVQARAIYYKMCLQFGRLSQTRIAATVNRDHATVIHSMKQWDVFMRFIPDFKQNYNFIRAAYLEGDLFEDKEKRITLDELLIKYNELLIKYDQLKSKFEHRKNCDCG